MLRGKCRPGVVSALSLASPGRGGREAWHRLECRVGVTSRGVPDSWGIVHPGAAERPADMQTHAGHGPGGAPQERK